MISSEPDDLQILSRAITGVEVRQWVLFAVKCS